MATPSVSANTLGVGWTIGGGTEWMLSGPWSAKLEYLYMDLGTVSNSFAGVGSFSSHITDNIVRARINYHFGGPVVAKY